METNNTQFINALKDIANNTDPENALLARVAKDALDSEGYELGYLQDVINHGCVSGSCRGLIYYVDTHAFYNQFQDQCDAIFHEYEENTGEGFKFNGQPVTNTLAWMAYEETARNILETLQMDF